MNLDSWENGELTASNISEISCGESLHFSTKDQYKTINRNQLSKVDLPVLRATSSNIDCGISLIQEISDMEDEFDGQLEGKSRRERMWDIFGSLKQKSKRKYWNFKKSISGIRSRLKLITRKNKDSAEGSLGISSSSSNWSGTRAKWSTSLERLKSFNKLKMRKTTSRGSKTRRKVAHVSSVALSRTKSKASYLSNICVSVGSFLRAKTVYNFYRLRNVIGGRFHKKNSRFVLYFRRGSDKNAVRKTMNCDFPRSESIFFENIYDSMEYISGNLEEEVEKTHEIVTNQVEMEEANGILRDSIQDISPSYSEGDVSECKEDLQKQSCLSFCEKEQASQLQELDLIRNYCNGCTESGRELDEETPTTVDSFPRLCSMDSTTCTSIQNDISNSNTPLPLLSPTIGKIMERLETIFLDFEEASVSSDVNSSDGAKYLIGEEDQEIISSLKDLVCSAIYSNKNELDKQSRFRSELIFTLLRQTLQYYENMKNPGFKTDSEEIRGLIFSAVQKLKTGGNACMH